MKSEDEFMVRLTYAFQESPFDDLYSNLELNNINLERDVIIDMNLTVMFDRVAKNKPYRNIKHIFIVVYDEDVPVCSVNLFMNENIHDVCGMYGIHISTFALISKKYKGLGESMLKCVFTYMRENRITRLVIPSPLPTMKHILDKNGFTRYSTDEAPIYARKMFGFITPNYEEYYSKEL